MKKGRSIKTRAIKASLGRPPARKGESLLDWLYKLRDHQVAHQRKGPLVVKGKDLPWEKNSQGRMQWYLHPAMEDVATRSMLFFRQEIPPRGRSGVQMTPGGEVIYIVQGRGYTLLDGVKHEWETEDVINIPIRSDGVKVQHVNLSRTTPVVLISAELNLVDMLGVNRGAEYKQIEPAPDEA